MEAHLNAEYRRFLLKASMKMEARLTDSLFNVVHNFSTNIWSFCLRISVNYVQWVYNTNLPNNLIADLICFKLEHFSDTVQRRLFG
jgi:hypothetical protein